MTKLKNLCNWLKALKSEVTAESSMLMHAMTRTMMKLKLLPFALSFAFGVNFKRGDQGGISRGCHNIFARHPLQILLVNIML